MPCGYYIEPGSNLMGLQHLEKTKAVRIPSRKITLTCSMSAAGWPRNSSRIYVPNLRFSGAEDKKDCSSNAYLCTKYILYNKFFCIQVLNYHLKTYRGSSNSSDSISKNFTIFKLKINAYLKEFGTNLFLIKSLIIS